MRKRHCCVYSIASFILLLLAILPVSAEPLRVGHLQAELIADVASIEPGRPFRAGLRLVMDDNWHVYWRNPGDAGLAPKLKWDLPIGFAAGEILWPAPERFEAPPLTSYGYHHEIVLPVDITPSAGLRPGDSVTIAADAQWLVCREECVPGQAALALRLPVSAQARPATGEIADLFNEAIFTLPIAIGDWGVSASIHGSELQLHLRPPDWLTGRIDAVTFFPYAQQVIANSEPQGLSASADGYVLRVPLSAQRQGDPAEVAGVLFSPSGWRGAGSEPAMEFSSAVEAGAPTVAAPASVDGITSVWAALLFAFLGGMILNLMPCVLPVLSLKILGFVRQAEEGHHSAVRHGLVFTAGVLVSFWLLAAALLLLQAGGAQLGWGFQLQSPAFIVVLAAFMFLFGLNLLGVFEVGNFLTGLGGGTAVKGGLTGSFVAGVTATVVATPCTAPFMGSALGFSLSQPAWVAMTIFTVIGLGMAAP